MAKQKKEKLSAKEIAAQIEETSKPSDPFEFHGEEAETGREVFALLTEGKYLLNDNENVVRIQRI